MGDSYSAEGGIAAVTATPGDTALAVVASTLTRGRIHYFKVAAGGTPADNVLQWLVRRVTASGTGTAVTPAALDGGAPTAQLTAKDEISSEPTVGAILFNLYVHQRALYQWTSAPGKEIVVPATADNGVGFTPIHASYTGLGQAVAHWVE